MEEPSVFHILGRKAARKGFSKGKQNIINTVPFHQHAIPFLSSLQLSAAAFT